MTAPHNGWWTYNLHYHYAHHALSYNATMGLGWYIVVCGIVVTCYVVLSLLRHRALR